MSDLVKPRSFCPLAASRVTYTLKACSSGRHLETLVKGAAELKFPGRHAEKKTGLTRLGGGGDPAAQALDGARHAAAQRGVHAGADQHRGQPACTCWHVTHAAQQDQHIISRHLACAARSEAASKGSEAGPHLWSLPRSCRPPSAAGPSAAAPGSSDTWEGAPRLPRLPPPAAAQHQKG